MVEWMIEKGATNWNSGFANACAGGHRDLAPLSDCHGIIMMRRRRIMIKPARGEAPGGGPAFIMMRQVCSGNPSQRPRRGSDAGSDRPRSPGPA